MYTQKTKSEEVAKPSNSVLRQTNEEKILISSDGKLRTPERLNLKVAYEGPEGKVTIAIIYGLVWIFARYDLDLRSRDNLLATVEVANAVFETLRSKGIKYVYCTADSVSAFKFNELLGFKSVNAVIHDKHEVMEKEL